MMSLALPSSTRLISRAWRIIVRVSPSLLRYCSSVTPPSRQVAGKFHDGIHRSQLGRKTGHIHDGVQHGQAEWIGHGCLQFRGLFIIAVLRQEPLHEFRVNVARAKVRVRHDPLLQRNAGEDAFHYEHIQRPRHARDRFLAVVAAHH